MRLRSEAILPVAADRYWLHMRNDPDFHRFEDKMHKTKSRTVVNRVYDNDGRLVSARTVTLPDMKQVKMPSMITGMLPNGQLALTDEWKIVQPEPKAFCTIVYSIKPNIYTDECTVRGRASFFPLDNGYCRHVVEAHIKVDIFLIGGMLESALANKIKEGHTKQPGIVAEYLKQLAVQEQLPASPSLPALPSAEFPCSDAKGDAQNCAATEVRGFQGPAQTGMQLSDGTIAGIVSTAQAQPQHRAEATEPPALPASGQTPSDVSVEIRHSLSTQSVSSTPPPASTPPPSSVPGREVTQLRHLLRAYHSQRFRHQAPAARSHWAEAHGKLRAQMSVDTCGYSVPSSASHAVSETVDARSSSTANDNASTAMSEETAHHSATDRTEDALPRSTSPVDVPSPVHAGYGVGKHPGSLSASPTDSLRQPPHKVAATENAVTHMPTRAIPRHREQLQEKPLQEQQRVERDHQQPGRLVQSATQPDVITMSTTEDSGKLAGGRALRKMATTYPTVSRDESNHAPRGAPDSVQPSTHHGPLALATGAATNHTGALTTYPIPRTHTTNPGAREMDSGMEGKTPSVAAKEPEHVTAMVKQSLAVHSVDSLLRETLQKSKEAADCERERLSSSTTPTPATAPTTAAVSQPTNPRESDASVPARTSANDGRRTNATANGPAARAATVAGGNNIHHQFRSNTATPQRQLKGNVSASIGKPKRKKSTLEDVENPWEALLQIAFNPKVWDELIEELAA